MTAAARRVELVYQVPEEHDSWLLEEDDVPESALHDAIILLLVEILIAWQRSRAPGAMVGRNIALRWNAARPQMGVDPDLYLVDPAPPEGEDVKSLCTWKAGHHAPRVAVEVVSEATAEKDYGDGPDRYAASGTSELWIFDPLLAGSDLRGGPHRLQVWRRDGQGRFGRAHAGDAPAWSEELKAWLVITDEGRRLRIADDKDGRRLWPTESEAERAAKEAAEAEASELRAEVERLRRELEKP